MLKQSKLIENKYEYKKKITIFINYNILKYYFNLNKKRLYIR
jgi:hypothetical protein